MRKQLFLETEVTNCITVETTQYDKLFLTQYRINGKKIRTLQHYQSEKEAKHQTSHGQLELQWKSKIKAKENGKQLEIIGDGLIQMTPKMMRYTMNTVDG